MSIQSDFSIPEFNLADRLRKAREKTGLDQAQFAAAIDVSRQTVSNYELSRVAPRKIVLRAWALRAGVPLEWLETGVKSESPSGGPEGQSVPGAEAGQAVRAKGFEPPTFCSVVQFPIREADAA